MKDFALKAFSALIAGSMFIPIFAAIPTDFWLLYFVVIPLLYFPIRYMVRTGPAYWREF